jgi:uncharacterized protein YdaL
MRATGLFFRSVVACVIVLAASWGAAATAAPHAAKALVLYTSDNTVAYGNVGKLYAIFLENLIGHFAVDVEIKEAGDCAPEKARAADALFFIGFIHDRKVAPRLLRAIAARKGPTIWFRYGVDQFLGAAADQGANLGLAFVGMRGFDDATPGGRQSFFDTVEYKGLKFVKYNGADAEPYTGVLKVTNGARAQAVATVVDSRTAERVPYAVHSRNFWYIADLPFSFTGPRDRYLVLADLLYDMLDEPPPRDEHPALVRLEDVHPLTQPQAIDRLSAYFADRKIPFSIALIPIYLDPFGRVRGTPQNVSLDDPRAAELVAALKRAVARGGAIVQHGTTHQFGTIKNPNSAVSGDDYEFWDIVNMRPFASLESEAAVRERIERGRAILTREGLAPFAFEPPHYQASPLGYRTIAQLFPVTYQRVAYYSNDRGRLGAPDALADVSDGQYFPYVIRRDYYGQFVLPENLGDLQYSKPTESVEDLLANADYAKVVRGGFASFFFHPFFLEGPEADRAMGDLDRIVTGIQKRGFHFVSADKLAQETRSAAP